MLETVRARGCFLLGLHGTEHSKCNHLMTLGFRGLTTGYTSQVRLQLYEDYTTLLYVKM